MDLDDGVLIPLRARDGSVRAYTTVDTADAEWVNRWRWCLNNHGYAVRGIQTPMGYRVFPLHRELLGLVHGDKREGDHINRDRLDNRRHNLRIVTRAENMQNLSAHGKTSRHRGVSWDKRQGQWSVFVTIGGRQVHLGRFNDEEEAAKVAREARALHAPFATN